MHYLSVPVILFMLLALAPIAPVNAYSTITVDTTWDTPRTISSDVVVDNYATLSIIANITFDCSDPAPSPDGLTDRSRSLLCQMDTCRSRTPG